MAPASLPTSIRHSTQNLLAKYNPNNYANHHNDEYETKNPTVTGQYAKLMEKSPPNYSKKQPSQVRLEPLSHQTLGTGNFNPLKSQDFLTHSIDSDLPTIPRKGKGILTLKEILFFSSIGADKSTSKWEKRCETSI